jgi:hypothetical protein
MATIGKNAGPDDSGLEDARRHMHVRRSSISAGVLAVLFAVAGILWSLFRFVACTGSAYELHDNWCEFSFGAPALLAILILVAFGWMVESIRRHGGDLELSRRLDVPASGRFARAGHHVAGGYRGLREDHRAHVRRTLVFASFMLGSVIAFVLFWYEMPPLLVFVVVVAVPSAVAIGNRWL